MRYKIDVKQDFIQDFVIQLLMIVGNLNSALNILTMFK